MPNESLFVKKEMGIQAANITVINLQLKDGAAMLENRMPIVKPLQEEPQKDIAYMIPLLKVVFSLSKPL